jgi:hypothetical protein
VRRDEEHERAALERFRADGHEVADLGEAGDPARAGSSGTSSRIPNATGAAEDPETARIRSALLGGVSAETPGAIAWDVSAETSAGQARALLADLLDGTGVRTSLRLGVRRSSVPGGEVVGEAGFQARPLRDRASGRPLRTGRPGGRPAVSPGVGALLRPAGG